MQKSIGLIGPMTRVSYRGPKPRSFSEEVVVFLKLLSQHGTCNHGLRHIMSKLLQLSEQDMLASDPHKHNYSSSLNDHGFERPLVTRVIGPIKTGPIDSALFYFAMLTSAHWHLMYHVFPRQFSVGDELLIQKGCYRCPRYIA